MQIYTLMCEGRLVSLKLSWNMGSKEIISRNVNIDHAETHWKKKHNI